MNLQFGRTLRAPAADPTSPAPQRLGHSFELQLHQGGEQTQPFCLPHIGYRRSAFFHSLPYRLL